MKNIVLLLSVAILLAACSKKLLDLSDGQYSVSELIESKNCDSSCYQQAACEGKTVAVYGYLDPDNIDKEHKSFVMVYHNKNIEVLVADNILDIVFDKLNTHSNSLFLVKGLVKGYDAPTNFVCDRKFTLQLSQADDVSIYQKD
jgi:hypothetical protein